MDDADRSSWEYKCALMVVHGSFVVLNCEPLSNIALVISIIPDQYRQFGSLYWIQLFLWQVISP